ncbi:hypothetical protein G5C60_10745 [Streptomyces sp. HC44]|uniref:Uncharacterized protein n=1 Tax=Streptomyces scabichelini TaxID=2711217 RepID=A0A6G4V2J9_9ACTN|nr:hypothetical protein [Streptomyces scabichelini]NGO08107.1 hypothetical protein [Streptomyces scabichelini]
MSSQADASSEGISVSPGGLMHPRRALAAVISATAAAVLVLGAAPGAFADGPCGSTADPDADVDVSGSAAGSDADVDVTADVDDQGAEVGAVIEAETEADIPVFVFDDEVGNSYRNCANVQI